MQLPVEQPILPPGAVADPPTAAAEVSILREDNVSATMLTADPLLSMAECAAWIAWAEGQRKIRLQVGGPRLRECTGRMIAQDST